MKTYIENRYGDFEIDGMTIPNDDNNEHYRTMMREVNAGTAEIIDYA